MGLLRRPLPPGAVALPPPQWSRSGLYLGMDQSSQWRTDGMPIRSADWWLDAILCGQRSVNGVDVTEATAIMLAGPGGYKTLGWLLGLVGLQDWPGPVLALSTRTDLARFGGPRRERLGKVQVLCWPGKQAASLPYQRVKWNPLDGCQDAGVAHDRMSGMIATVELGRPPAEAIWSEGSASLLAGWAHAAALEGSGIERVLGWARRDELKEPQRIMKAKGSRAGFGEEMAALATKADGPRTSIIQSAHPPLAGFADPAVLDGCTPDLIEPGFDIDGFLASTDTLFVLDKGGSGTVSKLAPLTVALVNACVERQAAKADAGSAGLMPLLLACDEVANISPLPNLVKVFSQARGWKITTAIAAQSWSQITERWGAAGASAIWDTSAYRLVGAGLQDQDGFLTNVSKSLGESPRWRPSVGSQSGGGAGGNSRKGKSENFTLMETPNYKMSHLTRLPEGKAILIGREGVRPVQLPALPSLLEALERAEELANPPTTAPTGPPDTAYGPDYQPDTWGWPPPKPPWWSRLRRGAGTREETP